MFLFLFLFNFILMNTTLEDDHLRSSIRILTEPTLDDSDPLLKRNLQETKAETFVYDCTKEICNNDGVNCNAEKTICTCKDEYTTLYGEHPCSYEKKRQLVAFLLELFVGFGGGHFYTERYLQASLKLVAFLFGIYIICLFPLTAKFIGDACESDCGVCLTSCFYYLYSLGLASWFIIDLVWFGKNYYPDGSGESLIPW